MTDAKFHIRTVEYSELDQLLELEKEWPDHSRATPEELTLRIDKFQEGFFIAEDNSGIIASIICYPYRYQPDDLSNFHNWETVIKKCYHTQDSPITANALYIVSGTTKPTHHGSELFDSGVNHVVDLAKKLHKQYVVGGCLLPGYARYVQKHEKISADEYVFKKSQERFIDPLIEKYRRLNFFVPDTRHVIADYFLHAPSLNYSALVIKAL
ncbi:MAG: hypothetical protein KIT56_02455 [Gammaproteobacteria bacterium]|nr:hypothetical protein [Gammaproteobacteria bacterium]MCW5582740.1 hypothetical protein [Gammaproteobacteria bacterium]